MAKRASERLFSCAISATWRRPPCAVACRIPNPSDCENELNDFLPFWLDDGPPLQMLEVHHRPLPALGLVVVGAPCGSNSVRGRPCGGAFSLEARRYLAH